MVGIFRPLNTTSPLPPVASYTAATELSVYYLTKNDFEAIIGKHVEKFESPFFGMGANLLVTLRIPSRPEHRSPADDSRVKVGEVWQSLLFFLCQILMPCSRTSIRDDNRTAMRSSFRLRTELTLDDLIIHKLLGRFSAHVRIFIFCRILLMPR